MENVSLNGKPLFTPDLKVVVDVEVCLKRDSTAAFSAIEEECRRFLSSKAQWFAENQDLAVPTDSHPFLASNVRSVKVCLPDEVPPGQPLLFWQVQPSIHVFQLSAEEGEDMEDEEEEGAVPSFKEWLLPCEAFHGLWDALFFDEDVKAQMLRFATSALLFSERGVSPHLIAWNRLVLLHGPPGTGKTSLSKALAQKLAIRFSDRFKVAQMIEVNAHSLFSKWFSESGKLVSKLFQSVGEYVEDPQALVFVLVDEVESLTAARQSALSGSEPSDAVRAVNAMLTHLDALKSKPNVMVICTSNLIDAIDSAFLDRADIKAYIGPPSLHARYEMLRGSLQELLRAGVVTCTSPAELPVPFPALEASGLCAAPSHCGPMSDSSCACRPAADEGGPGDGPGGSSTTLLEVARECEGLSGRTLRKLPFLAHVRSSLVWRAAAGGQHGCGEYIQAMLQAARIEQESRRQAGATGGSSMVPDTVGS